MFFFGCVIPKWNQWHIERNILHIGTRTGTRNSALYKQHLLKELKSKENQQLASY